MIKFGHLIRPFYSATITSASSIKESSTSPSSIKESSTSPSSIKESSSCDRPPLPATRPPLSASFCFRPEAGNGPTGPGHRRATSIRHYMREYRIRPGRTGRARPRDVARPTGPRGHQRRPPLGPRRACHRGLCPAHPSRTDADALLVVLVGRKTLRSRCLATTSSPLLLAEPPYQSASHATFYFYTSYKYQRGGATLPGSYWPRCRHFRQGADWQARPVNEADL